MERYEATEPDFHAQLINGVVFTTGRKNLAHGEASAAFAGWMGHYSAFVEGIRGSIGPTVLLDDRNVFEPDSVLRRMTGGQTWRDGDYLAGAPELVAEVAMDSASIEVHAKRSEYERLGVPEYIVWRVYDEAIDWCTLIDAGYERLLPDDGGIVHSLVFPGLRLAVQALIDGDMTTVLATQMEPEA